MMGTHRLIILTRDSARWIGHVLSAYRELGVEPLYIVDSRSKDKTLEILQALKADCIPFTPRGEIVEAGMIEFGSKAAGTEWVLRVDDDEFPSRELLDWVVREGVTSEAAYWGISRKEISFQEAGFVYSRWPPRVAWIDDRFVLNPQIRLYRANAVRYVEKLHTPGFEAPPPLAFAPEGCSLIHFNNIVRSVGERIAKVRKYALINEKLAWRLIDECLPELTDPSAQNYANDGLAEFLGLLESLPEPACDASCTLTDREQMLMTQGTQAWLAESARGAQAALHATQAALHATHAAMRAKQEEVAAMRAMQEEIQAKRALFWLLLVPKPILQGLAEFLLTIGRRMNLRVASEVGLRAWNLQKQEARRKAV
jgi:hypothetical protein